MKNKLIIGLLITLSLFLLVGCKPTINENPLDDSNDTNIDNNENSNIDTAESGDFYVTFDANGGTTKFLAITETDETNDSSIIECASWLLKATENETIKDTLTDNNILSIEPVDEENSFEGWVVFKELLIKDENGYDIYNFEKPYGDKLYSTEEVLKMSMPSNNIVFVAKWANLPIDDYMKINFNSEEEIYTPHFPLNANGGMLVLKEDEFESFTQPRYVFWINEGQTFLEAMTDKDNNKAKLISVEKEDATFDGWTVYETDYIAWNTEKIEEENFDYLPYDEDSKYLKYILLKNKVLYASNLSTEDLLKIKSTGKSYYAIANWK